ncbi:cytochrome c biogenesis protein CcdA [Herpetosiphon gulosus]|uniref:Cytochrome C biogenesis protein transmembrane domain-containing protein n=1 Tax=Herpetosiphon gulosus TaxID=1973496 RepID=A0ABP9X898_9CHLR
MSQYFEAFLLGNGAILGNVCMLPLYPGMLAYVAGTQQQARPAWFMAGLGILVLSGILTLMVVVGLIAFVLQQSLSTMLPVLLPLLYGTVIILGILLLLDRNPFTRISQLQIPIMRHPAAGAFIYGLGLGPMTLPCTGPLVMSAFLLGVGDPLAVIDGILYFVWFGVGFGWPLVVLPVFAQPMQRAFTKWTTRSHRWLNRFSGIVLVAIGLFGIVVEVLPNL